MLVCTLLLRYCITMFANLAVAGFWTCCWYGHCGFGGGRAEVCVEEVHWVGGSGPGRKRIRQNRANFAHLEGLVVRFRPRVWKRLRHLNTQSVVSYDDCKTMRYDQHDLVMFLFKTGLGWEDSRGKRRPTSPGLHAWN